MASKRADEIASLLSSFSAAKSDRVDLFQFFLEIDVRLARHAATQFDFDKLRLRTGDITLLDQRLAKVFAHQNIVRINRQRLIVIFQADINLAGPLR